MLLVWDNCFMFYCGIYDFKFECCYLICIIVVGECLFGLGDVVGL